MAVAETQNCAISIYRGTTVNQFGDQVDANTPFLEHLPATLVETGRKTQDPSSPTPRTIRDIVLHVPGWAGLTTGDRVLDESTGDIYMVITVTRPGTLTGVPVDLLATLKRVTANSV